MRRVLFIIHTPTFGGPHNQILRLFSSLREQGWEYVALLPREEGDGAKRLRDIDVEVVQIDLHRLRKVWSPAVHWMFLRSLPGEIKALRKVIRERKIDIVQVCGVQNPQGAVAARLESVPVVWQLLSTYAPWPVRLLLSPLVWWLADVVMSTGVTVAQRHPGVVQFAKRWIPFYPPVDTALFHPDQDRRVRARAALDVPNDALLVGTVGNFSRQKAHEYLIEAAALLQKRCSNVFFRIIGREVWNQRAYYKKEVIEKANRLGLLQDGRLRFVEGGEQVPSLIAAFDVFVLSSRAEGVPTVALEAMSCGIPVVSTRVGAIHEVVEEGNTGFLVPFGDAKVLADAVERLINDPYLRAAMGEQARKRVHEKFSFQRCLEAHMKAYEFALTDGKDKRR